jgi:transcriptional regulator with XRE-family HTH domain
MCAAVVIGTCKHGFARRVNGIGAPDCTELSTGLLTNCAWLCTTWAMAELTAGQRAAIRAAKARRGELGLTQTKLADNAGVHRRTYQDFERGLAWPHATTLAHIERLGLNWYAGKLSDIATGVDEQDAEDPPTDGEGSDLAFVERWLIDQISRLRREEEELADDISRTAYRDIRRGLRSAIEVREDLLRDVRQLRSAEVRP